MCVCSVTQSCLSLHNPMDCSLLGSSALGIFQARILEWVAISEDLLDLGTKPMSPAYPTLASRFFTTNAT